MSFSKQEHAQEARKPGRKGGRRKQKSESATKTAPRLHEVGRVFESEGKSESSEQEDLPDWYKEVLSRMMKAENPRMPLPLDKLLPQQNKFQTHWDLDDPSKMEAYAEGFGAALHATVSEPRKALLRHVPSDARCLLPADPGRVTRPRNDAVSIEEHVQEVITNLSNDIKRSNWEKARNDLTGSVWLLARDRHGSLLLQKVLKDKNAQGVVETVLNELKGNVLAATLPSPNASSDFSNYVLLACISENPPEKFAFIIQELKGHVKEACLHVYGCRVVQELVNHVGEKDDETGTLPMLCDEILPFLREISTDRYGNFVIQKFSEMASDKQKDLVSQELLKLDNLHEEPGVLAAMCKDRYASNVIEKAVNYSSSHLREHWTQKLVEILEHQGRLKNGLPAKKVGKDRYGSFIKKMLKRYRKQDMAPKSKSAFSSSCSADGDPFCLQSSGPQMPMRSQQSPEHQPKVMPHFAYAPCAYQYSLVPVGFMMPFYYQAPPGPAVYTTSAARQSCGLPHSETPAPAP